MKIYLAGSCGIDRRTQMKKIAEYLRKIGYEVYCPFELKIENAWDMSQEDWAQKVFEADVAAIDACDLVIMLSPGRASTAGTNWEQGYAYAKGKKIFVFQYTNDPASLMTYCGCDQFYSVSTFLASDSDDITHLTAARIALITKHLIENDKPKRSTNVVLT